MSTFLILLAAFQASAHAEMSLSGATVKMNCKGCVLQVVGTGQKWEGVYHPPLINPFGTTVQKESTQEITTFGDVQLDSQSVPTYQSKSGYTNRGVRAFVGPSTQPPPNKSRYTCVPMNLSSGSTDSTSLKPPCPAGYHTVLGDESRTDSVTP